jgi:hypothetical protein
MQPEAGHDTGFNCVAATREEVVQLQVAMVQDAAVLEPQRDAAARVTSLASTEMPVLVRPSRARVLSTKQRRSWDLRSEA